MNIFQNMHSTARPSPVYVKAQAGAALPWEPDSHERIMIIAPHPDDEVLAAGGVLATAQKLHNDIRVVVATNGDASYATALWHGSHFITKKNFESQAVMRQKETLNALTCLGMGTQQVHFWGFPDRGLVTLWKSHEAGGRPYRSPTTGHNTSIQALNSPVLPYTKNSLAELFGNELLEFCPTLVIMPHPYDNHSDHSALAGFTLLAIKRYAEAHRSPPVLLAYWMWQKQKPWLTGKRPHDLAAFHLEADSTATPDLHLTLSPEIRAQKMRAMQCYPSQKIAAGKIFRETSRKLYETFTPMQIAL